VDARFDIQGLSIRELLLKGRNLNFQSSPSALHHLTECTAFFTDSPSALKILKFRLDAKTLRCQNGKTIFAATLHCALGNLEKCNGFRSV